MKNYWQTYLNRKKAVPPVIAKELDIMQCIFQPIPKESLYIEITRKTSDIMMDWWLYGSISEDEMRERLYKLEQEYAIDSK